MKTLKTALLFLATIMVFGSTSCKYEEGGLSLRTKKARVAGDWFISEIIDSDGSGETYTNDGTDIYTFEKDGTAKNTYSYEDFSGNTITETENFEWEFEDGKEKLKFIFEDNSFETFTILKLKHKEMWIKVEDGDDSTEIRFEAAE